MAAPGSANTSGSADVRSPSLSSDEQSSEASLITEGGVGGAPLPPDTPDNLALLVLDSVLDKQPGLCTGELVRTGPARSKRSQSPEIQPAWSQRGTGLCLQCVCVCVCVCGYITTAVLFQKRSLLITAEEGVCVCVCVCVFIGLAAYFTNDMRTLVLTAVHGAGLLSPSVVCVLAGGSSSWFWS